MSKFIKGTHPSESWDLDSCLRRNVKLFICVVILIVGMMSVVLADDKPTACRIIDNQTPSNDVAYQAGVDVYGNAVVPADLNSTGFKLPKIIKVPLNINLAERMNILVYGLDLEAPLGTLEIHHNGRVTYNGEDWTAPMATLCGQSHKVEQEAIVIEAPAQNKDVEIEVKTVVEDDGLKGEDVIKSSERVIEVAPTVAIPPQDVNIEQLQIDPPAQENVESDVIEGGEYREIYYNE